VRRKRTLIYVAACLICAGLATAVAFSYIARASAGSQSTDRIEILLAMRDIQQGETLSLTGDSANVRFVAWPRDVVPEGAIREEKDVTEQRWRARTEIVKHEVIQKSRLVSEDQYVPSDMYLQMVRVPEEDLKSGRLRLGMKVDVLQVVDRRPVEFMRCAEIWAIGRLDARGLPVIEKDPPPNVWLLLKKADQAAFVEAEYSSKLLVVESTETQCSEPYLVHSVETEQERQKQAEALLSRAKSMTQAGQYQEALSVLDELINEYSDVSTVAGRAAVEQTKTREAMAQSLYDRARTALEQEEDFSGALRLLDQLDAVAPPASPVREKAGALRSRAESALEKHRLQVQYEALLGQMQSALDGGNLPKAQDVLSELESFSKQGVEFEGVRVQPKEAVDRYGRQLKSKTGDFSIMKQAMQLFLKRNDLQAAQAKLDQLKRDFPAHPEIGSLEQAVEAARSTQ